MKEIYYILIYILKILEDYIKLLFIEIEDSINCDRLYYFVFSVLNWDITREKERGESYELVDGFVKFSLCEDNLVSPTISFVIDNYSLYLSVC